MELSPHTPWYGAWRGPLAGARPRALSRVANRQPAQSWDVHVGLELIQSTTRTILGCACGVAVDLHPGGAGIFILRNHSPAFLEIS
jgi:hypothetical protein